MPALETPHEPRPVLGHVNLMVDSFIANADVDDMRAVIRTMLATNPPSVTTAFTAAARRRLDKTTPKSLQPSTPLFLRGPNTSDPAPTPELHRVLCRARSLYGAGMGFASVALLTEVVKASTGLTWDVDGAMADALAEIDADITQAIQSSKEELAGGRVVELPAARMTVDKLHAALTFSARDVESWGGEFPFERSLSSVQYWKF